jgi:hypothetical protein
MFCRFEEDMPSFESCDTNARVFSSRHHSCDVEIHTQIMFVVQDQPERRHASGILGGRSNLHPLFGTSCDFNSLELPFEACSVCQLKVHNYIAAKNWSIPPLSNPCDQCLSGGIYHLTDTTYTESYSCPNNFPLDTPGSLLFGGPDSLTSTLL